MCAVGGKGGGAAALEMWCIARPPAVFEPATALQWLQGILARTGKSSAEEGQGQCGMGKAVTEAGWTGACGFLSPWASSLNMDQCGLVPAFELVHIHVNPFCLLECNPLQGDKCSLSLRRPPAAKIPPQDVVQHHHSTGWEFG